MYLSCILTHPDYPWKWFLPTLIRVPRSQDSQEGIHVSSLFLCSTSHLERIHYHEEGQRWDKDCPWNCHEDGLGAKWRPHQDYTDHTCSWILPDLTRSYQIFQDLSGSYNSYRFSTAERSERETKPQRENCHTWHDIARYPSPAHLAWKKPVSSKHTRFMWRVLLHCLPWASAPSLKFVSLPAFTLELQGPHLKPGTTLCMHLWCSVKRWPCILVQSTNFTTIQSGIIWKSGIWLFCWN